MNYFIHDERDLSPAYVRKCKKFLKEISLKPQAARLTACPRDDRISYYERYKKETSKTGEEIPTIPGSGDQRHADEGLQSSVVCCTTGQEN